MRPRVSAVNTGSHSAGVDMLFNPGGLAEYVAPNLTVSAGLIGERPGSDTVNTDPGSTPRHFVGLALPSVLLPRSDGVG